MSPVFKSGDLVEYLCAKNIKDGDFIVLKNEEGKLIVHQQCSKGAKGFRNKYYDHELFDGFEVEGKVTRVYLSHQLQNSFSLLNFPFRFLITRLNELNHGHCSHHRFYSFIGSILLSAYRKLMEIYRWS